MLSAAIKLQSHRKIPVKETITASCMDAGFLDDDPGPLPRLDLG
jgi:hypothetical protein